ncbi:MAG: RagB/SusD family nutrient uptake outer membrane protein [Muribaculaceae bacterium]|nr:RagB/SusD family nutrient uptake outer membrane protein [Muribaculaceae bacterium]MDE7092149.1 RagB/SusD family nutrient uptake outer membrane protein [Muribaculaceae bacterium]MDE7155681.1 RagB/SusD family nutrient uptake outer membrane protein [Muribaculaceae bacterium]MDE7369939.1 RagB/SusD family nutrient uptake outer membrane protein [Muribaculaceae bacterium]
MKNKYIIGGFVAAMMAPALVSCSDSYLDESPLTNISAVTVSSSEEGAMAAVTGLARQMQRQYSNLKNGNLNVSGETYLATIYGEGLGPDGNFGEITAYLKSGIKPENFRYPNGWWGSWMYRYAYSFIGSANSILADIDDDTTDSNQLWLKASALTMRAHAYTRLMQVFAPRWADSDNGNKYVLVLRIHAGEPNDHPFNTCNEIYDQMYADLDEALRCFELTKKKRGDDLFYVNEDVARGIYARLALLKNDYKTAQKMAHDARQNYPIMDPEDYMNGFSTDTSESMWSPAHDPLGIYYWNFGNHYACNGHYVSGSWGYTCAMEYNLYKEMKATDVRSRLYFGPLTVEHAPDLAKKYEVTAEDFFVDSIYSPQSTLFSITGSGTKPKGKNLAMWNFIKAYGKQILYSASTQKDGIYALNKYGLAFGTQFKFQSVDDGYTSCWVPYMRSAEMLLIEAEAACQNGDDATALACLKELMAKRDSEYSFSGAGAELLAEVKLQRRIELWGEGFNFFDYKRWAEPITFRTFKKDDMANMGSFPAALAATYQPDFMNGWRAAIPTNEFDYNKEADASLVGQ